MTDSSSEEETICVAMMLQEDQPKRIWVHDINKKRNEFGEFHTIFHDLTEDDKKFFIYFRMSYAKFCELLLAIEPRIEKNTNFREAITPRVVVVAVAK